MLVFEGLGNPPWVSDSGLWGEHVRAMPFHEAVYAVMTTATLTGFGDVPPATAFGRITVAAMLVLLAALVPLQGTRLYRRVRFKRSPRGRRYKGNAATPHAIVFGDVCTDDAFEFIEEFFHVDHGTARRATPLLLCSLTPPTHEVRTLVRRYNQDGPSGLGDR